MKMAGKPIDQRSLQRSRIAYRKYPVKPIEIANGICKRSSRMKELSVKIRQKGSVLQWEYCPKRKKNPKKYLWSHKEVHR